MFLPNSFGHNFPHKLFVFSFGLLTRPVINLAYDRTFRDLVSYLLPAEEKVNTEKEPYRISEMFNIQIPGSQKVERNEYSTVP